MGGRETQLHVHHLDERLLQKGLVNLSFALKWISVCGCLRSAADCAYS